MLKISIFFILAWFCQFSASKVHGQELTYEILWKDDSIGYLLANKKPVKSLMKYSIQSDVSVRFIARLEMVYQFENIFSNGVLVKGTSRNFINDKLKSSSTIKWEGQKYTAFVDESEVFLENKPIRTSMTLLYYEEPRGIKEVFSERFAEYCPIIEISPHKYELTLPNGKKNYYTYKDGLCTLVEVNHALATFYFKLKNHNGKLVLN